MTEQKPTLLLLETVSSEADDLLNDQANVLMSTNPDLGMQHASNDTIQGIITRGKGKVDKQLISNLKGLKVIGRCGVGLDNIDVNAASKLGIIVINAPGSNADTVAEHTLSLMLSAQRKMYDSIEEVKKGNWNYRTNYEGDEIRGKTLGIIGMGDIGEKVAKLAKAFGMNVIFWNRTPISSPFNQVSMDTLLTTSDIISIHLALNQETKGLLSADSFRNNQKKPILINTSRGGIIEDSEVVKALQNEYISVFAADVLSKEPPNTENSLLSLPNVYITPHSASLTAQTYNEMCVLTVRNVLSVIKDEPIDPRFIFNSHSL